LRIKYPGGKNLKKYMDVNIPLNSSIGEGSYELEFYNRGSATSYNEIYIGEEKIITFGDFEKESIDEYWTKFSKTFSYNGKEENFVTLRYYGGTSGQCIDNFSLKASEDETELVYDGSFEEFVELPEEPFDTAAYRPTDMFSSSFSQGIALNWRNPVSTTFTGVEVFDITTGTEVKIEAEIPQENSAVVVLPISGLEQGKSYQYKLVFSFSDKNDFVFFLGDTSEVSGTLSSAVDVGDWNFMQVYTGKAGYCPAIVGVDFENGYESNSSLKLISHINQSQSDMVSNIYVRARTDLPLEAGKRYKVSYYQKSKNVTMTPQVHTNLAKFEGETLLMPYTGTYEWKKHEYFYTNTEGNNTLVILMNGKGNLWFDNIEVCEVDSEGNETGKNLILSEDFENIVSKNESELTQVKAESGNGELYLSWQAPKDCDEINIYEKKFDEFEYRGTVSASLQGLKISGLEKGKEYTYKLVPKNAYNAEGKESVITTTTLLPDYEIYKPILYKDSESVEKLSGEGKYKVTIPIKNNTLTDGFKAEVLLATYKDGILTSLSSEDINIKKTPKNKDFSKILGYSKQVFLSVPQ